MKKRTLKKIAQSSTIVLLRTLKLYAKKCYSDKTLTTIYLELVQNRLKNREIKVLTMALASYKIDKNKKHFDKKIELLLSRHSI